MKILFVIPYYAPAFSYGGPVVVAQNIAEGIVKKGFSVTVLTTDVFDAKSRNYKTNEKLNGVDVVRLRNFSNVLAKHLNFFFPFGLKGWINQNIKEYDLIHFHDVFSNLFIYTSKKALAYGIPYIIQPHGSLNDTRLRIGKLRYLIKKMLLKKYSHNILNAKSIIALTNAEKNEIESLYNKTVINIIPNGIDIPSYSNTVNIRTLYNISDSEKIIVYIGRLHYVKGIDISLQVLAKIKQKLNFKFLIFGPDEQNEMFRLKDIVRKHNLQSDVIFAGPVFDESKFNILKASDLFLFLSRDEALPITVLEALSVGLPVFISKETNVPEIADYNAGIVIEKEIYDETAEKITQLLNDSGKMLEMRINAIKLFNDKFTLELMLEKFSSLYKQKCIHIN